MEVYSSLKLNTLNQTENINIFNDTNCQISPESKYPDSKFFEKFSFNFDELKLSNGYVDANNLIINNNCNNGCTDTMKHLKIRDKIIDILKRCLEDLSIHGKLVEKEEEFLKFKNETIYEEIKVLEKKLAKKEKLLKKNKSKKTTNVTCNKSTQTLNITCHTSTQTDKSFSENSEEYSNKTSIFISDKPQEPEGKGILSPKEAHIDKSVDLNKTKTNKVEMQKCDFPTSQHFKKDANEYTNVGDILNEELSSEHIKHTNNDWDLLKIKEEVQTVAEEITNQLGYVFIDEIGMYYDHSSGYYYDDKTGLFYDGKTGTYFYYSHETNNYEFYAQVEPNNTVETLPKAREKKKKISKPTDNLEKEEGECSNSEEEEEIEEVLSPIPDPNNKEGILTSDSGERTSMADVAPSLRLMVMNGDLKGSLHIVTLDGGTMGREGDVQVLLKDPSVSKLHAEIVYQSDGPSDHHYFIRDLGSSNGTLVKGQQISEPKILSELVEVGHSWEIQLGEVILSCHIHPGLLTCNECEPGLVELQNKEKTKTCTSKLGPKQKLEKERRRQNKVIKKKFSLNWFEDQPTSTNLSYNDRAVKRRETVGSDNPYEKTQVASIDSNLTKDNKGFQLLQKMGWSEGQSLGVSESGITEPIIPSFTSGRTGLGRQPLLQDVFQDSGERRANVRGTDKSEEIGENINLVQKVKFIPASSDSNKS